MKKTAYLYLLLTLLSFQVTTAMAHPKPDKVKIENMTAGEKKARLQEIEIRATEIKNMDKSNLTREERKELKKEVKEMRQEARAISGVYLSVGAIIIILLLLIIIL